MKFSRNQWIAAAVILAGIAVGVMVMRQPGDKADNAPKPADATGAAKKPASAKRPAIATAKAPAKAAPRPEKSLDSLSDEDRRLSDAVQDALDADDFEQTRAAALKAYQSKDPEVRQQAVEALGWFGEKSLVDLVSMMADADANVAEAAANAWEHGLSEVSDATLKWDIARAALGAINSPDTLTLVGAQFTSAAMELIDAEEDKATASRRRQETVQTLAELINSPSSPKRAEIARDLYEEITGHRWAGNDEAKRYLSDPENYEAPEAPEEAAE